jgi:hypothetical protein
MNSSTTVSIESKMNLINSMISNIPKKLFFIQENDFDRVIRLLSYLHQHVPESKGVDQNKLIRQVISKHLRLVNMKMVDVKILLLVALKRLKPSDLELSESKIVSKLLVENKDNHDLDILNRIVAQIRTKLPFDLRERLNYEHIVAVKQRVYSYLKSGGNMLEDFVDVNDIKLTEIDTPDELAMFHMELARARGKDPANVQLNLSKTDHLLAMKELDVETRVKEAKEKIKELTLELENEDLSKNQRQNIELKIKLNEWRIKSLTNQDLSSYNNQEKAHLQKIANQEDIQELIRQEDLEHINMSKEQKIKANYVDRKPLLMVDPDLQKDYYYDKHSRTLKRLPNESELKPVSMEQVEDILEEHDISNREISKTLTYLDNNNILEEEEPTFLLDQNYMDEQSLSKKIGKDSDIIRKIMIGLGVAIILVILGSLILFKDKVQIKLPTMGKKKTSLTSILKKK